jgi:RNA recognition motif-containing protein
MAAPEVHNTLYVGNLDSNTSEADLIAFFSPCGEIEALKLAGYGVVLRVSE